MKLFAYSAWDAVLVLLSFLYASLVFFIAIIFSRLTWQWVCVAALLYPFIDLTVTHAQHYHSHTPFFIKNKLNIYFDLLLSAVYGYPQSYYIYQHNWHHKNTKSHRPDSLLMLSGLTPFKNCWTTFIQYFVDVFNLFWISKLIWNFYIDPEQLIKPIKITRIRKFANRVINSPRLRSLLNQVFNKGLEREFLELGKKRARQWQLKVITEGIVIVLFRIVLCTLNYKFFFFFYLPCYYLANRVAHSYQEFCEHYRVVKANDTLSNAVSSYGKWYNFIWFNNGYHQEHHYRPKIHWTKVKDIRNQMLPEDERRVVPKAHWFSPFVPILLKTEKNQIISSH